jgi:hypothetical protein
MKGPTSRKEREKWGTPDLNCPPTFSVLSAASRIGSLRSGPSATAFYLHDSLTILTSVIVR